MGHWIAVIRFFNVCHFLCVYPSQTEYSPSTKQVQFKNNTKIYLARMAAMLVSQTSGIVYIFCYEYSLETLQEWVFIICTCGTLALIFQINLTCLVHQETIHMHITRMLKIERALGLQDIAWLKRFYTGECVFLVFMVACVFVFYFCQYDFPSALAYNAGFNFPKLIIIFQSLTFVNLLLLLKTYFRKINLTPRSQANFVIYYSQLTSLCKNINRSYQHVNLTIFGHHLVWAIYELYHLAILLSRTGDRKYHPKYIISGCGWTMASGCIMAAVLFACQWVEDEAEKFKHNLIDDVDNDYRRYLSVINLNVCFTAADWFKLNKKFLLSVRFIYIKHFTGNK